MPVRSHTFTESTFVGDSRKLLVESLLRFYDDALQNKCGKWLSLEAPSGWGKTRLAREFYARLAAHRQSSPLYWPATINDPRLGRKAVHPGEANRERGSLPDFLWWGINCSNRHGVPAEALREDLYKLEMHAVFVELAFARSIPSKTRLVLAINRYLKNKGRPAAKEALLQTLAAIAGETAKGLAPLIGPAIEAATSATMWAKGRKHKYDLVKSTSFADAKPPDIVDEICETIAVGIEHHYPVILLIEDLHLADDLLLDLLNKLLKVPGPLLVITTSWPRDVTTEQGLASLFETYRDKVIRVRHDKPTDERLLKGAALCELELDARRHILKEAFPKVSHHTMEALLERYSNPLAVELVCQVLGIYEDDEDLWDNGALHLPFEILDRLPSNISDLYRQIWNQLPFDLKMALAVAHIITPANIDADQGWGENRWSQHLQADVIENVIPKRFQPAAIIAQLKKDANAQGWVHVIDEYLRAFLEPVYDKTVGMVGDEFIESHLYNPRGKILDHLANTVLEEPLPEGHNRNRARTVLALHSQGYIASNATAAKAIQMLLSEWADSLDHLPERIKLYEYFEAIRCDEIDDHTAWAISEHGACVLAEGGDFQRAITIVDRVLAERKKRGMGENDRDVLRTAHMAASFRGGAGEWKEAIDRMTDVIARQTKVLRSDHPQIWDAKFDLGIVLGLAHHFDEAATEMDTLHAVLSAALGQSDPFTLRTAHMAASFRGGAGEWREAACRLERIIDHQTKELGSDHPDTLHTRLDQATCLAMAGESTQAISLLKGLLKDQRLMLFHGHPKRVMAQDLYDRLVTAD